jgi:cation:H+ antiporter
LLLDLQNWPVWSVVALFLAATGTIAVAGIRMTRIADRLADLSGLGEALFGAVLLGGSTSLPGIVTSVWTAWEGHPQLAVSNAIGGIAAQTVFLVVADIAHRDVNLEHAAASVENLVQAALLMTLLAIPLLAMSGPDYTVWQVHPASALLLSAYLFGLNLVSRAKAAPLWRPHRTRDTQMDDDAASPEEPGEAGRLWISFAGLALVVATAGFAVAQTGIAIAAQTGMSETLVGMLLTAVATSLPELVTSVAAVRQGALTLAVGGIIGGNSFDVLFIAFADVAYRDGSIYHAMVNQQVFIIALTLLMTGVILLGLLRREKTGFANIGFESLLVLILYFGAVGLLVYA